MKKIAIIIGVLLFSGIVNAICDTEQNKVILSLNGYNSSITSRMGELNKGDTGQACSINVQTGNIIRAYEDLALCYDKEGNRIQAMKTMNTTEEWVQKSIEWGTKCDPASNGADAEYGLLAEVYKKLNDPEKACNSCKESNKNRAISRVKMVCKYYGCPEEDAGSGSASSDMGGSGSFLFIVAGGIVLSLIVAAFFLLNRTHKKR